MATPCPKSLHGKGEKWIARNILHRMMFITLMHPPRKRV